MSRSPIIIPGFSFASIPAGIKKSGEHDLALIVSENTAITAGAFTTNKIKAAPVKLAINQISSHKAQAIIINSGNANACTGERGYRDAEEMAEITAKTLRIPSKLVYVSSTGVIGRPLPMGRIKKAVPHLVKNLSPFYLDNVASAIMTTDTFPKIYSKKIRIGKKTGIIAGIAKGAGMICPNMATMLCFLFTDLVITPESLHSALMDSVNSSFNSITIDNDMSTNDTVMIMANGLLQNDPISKNSSEYRKFSKTLHDVTFDLAKMVVKDGEGATKLIELTVTGAKTEEDAKKVARSVANSMLVKTAIYGQDPNWGRIIAAIGYSGGNIDEKKISIKLNNIMLVSRGIGKRKEALARKLLGYNNISLSINLGMGTKRTKLLTCDLTEKYVKINAHYTT